MDERRTNVGQGGADPEEGVFELKLKVEKLDLGVRSFSS
jgi:hypothetical protein